MTENFSTATNNNKAYISLPHKSSHNHNAYFAFLKPYEKKEIKISTYFSPNTPDAIPKPHELFPNFHDQTLL